MGEAIICKMLVEEMPTRCSQTLKRVQGDPNFLLMLLLFKKWWSRYYSSNSLTGYFRDLALWVTEWVMCEAIICKMLFEEMPTRCSQTLKRVQGDPNFLLMLLLFKKKVKSLLLL